MGVTCNATLRRIGGVVRWGGVDHRLARENRGKERRGKMDTNERRRHSQTTKPYHNPQQTNSTEKRKKTANDN